MVAGQDHLGSHKVFPDAAHIFPGDQCLLDLEILVVQEVDVLYHNYRVGFSWHWPSRIDGPGIPAYPQRDRTIRARAETGLCTQRKTVHSSGVKMRGRKPGIDRRSGYS